MNRKRAPGKPRRSKRLVLFVPGLQDIGGASSRTRLLLSELENRGFELRVVARSSAGRRYKRTRRRNLTIIEVPGFSHRRLGLLLYVPTALIAGVAWARSASAILALQLFSQLYVAAAVSRIAKLPLLGFSTTSGELSEGTLIRQRRGSRIRMRALRQAHTIVSQTRFGKEEFRALIDTNVIVIPNPVDIGARVVHSGNPSAYFAGRFSSEKDLDVLLNAWEKLNHTHVGARLFLIGTGGAHRSVEDAIRAQVVTRKLEEFVTFVPWTDDLESAVRTIDIFVLPSRSEGMSNALIEACAWGKVVVASNIEPNVEILGPDYPLLFDVGDSSSLCEQLSVALTDESTRQKSVALARDGVQVCRTESVINQIEDLIETATRTRH
ncbi:MAG TPA: glycosyltransferase family 4 protein [Actinomycetota bacterium]|nr:glycosyltransferase family 4 protein [Actinomycetota bacterium]